MPSAKLLATSVTISAIVLAPMVYAAADTTPSRQHVAGQPTPTTPGNPNPKPTPGPKPGHGPGLPGGYKNIVVIYQENRSFDNLYGTWGKVGDDHVDGIPTTNDKRGQQVDQKGKAFTCLAQNDVNLTSPTPLPTTCTDADRSINSAFTNRPFRIDEHITPTDTTCPKAGTNAPNGVLKGAGEPGGCTEDLVHRFYQNQYQINGGNNDRFVTGSDAVGLTMGHYDSSALPLYRYLHHAAAPKYVIADRFFQAAFGGSFLNHQYLVAARAPIDTSGGTQGGKHSVIDANGMPRSYSLYTSPIKNGVDGQLTATCPGGGNDASKACGDFGINTMQPASAPKGGGAVLPTIDSATNPTIADRLTDADVSWKWYSGGWDDAVAGKPGPLFQFHHQPLNYFSNTAAGGRDRAKLVDEKKFFADAKAGVLPQVSFVKPYGAENEHPGYASADRGSSHTVDLIKAVVESPQAKDTLIVLTYDENGGFWDHVAPPSKGNNTKGVHDAFGPGTRIPAMLISAKMTRSGVDSTSYDTTSILATLEKAYGLTPLSTRDAAVAPLTNAITTGLGHSRKN